MFAASNAKSLNLSSFDTSNVTTMHSMFGNFYSMNTPGPAATIIKGLEKFNTGNVTNMSWMFYKCQLDNLDLSNFDTSKVTSMASMFKDSTVSRIVGLDKFVTNKVVNMSYMLQNSKLNTLDLSNFNIENVTNTNYMFNNATSTTGYAKDTDSATRFNTYSVTKIPSTLKFTVK